MLVGLMGRKRAGKDSVANVLVDDFDFARASFAGPMKDALLALNPIVDPWDGARLAAVIADRGWERAKAMPEVRTLLQRFGTEMGRKHFGENFWIDLAFDRIGTMTADRSVVITDVRFPNEADAIRAYGGKLLRIVRPETDNHGDAHPSETALDEYKSDDLIVNDASLLELEAAVHRYMNHTTAREYLQGYHNKEVTHA